MSISRYRASLDSTRVCLGVLVVLLAGCRIPVGRAGEESPVQQITWRGDDNEWLQWGASGSSIFATSANPTVVDVWQWAGTTMKNRWKQPVGDGTLAIGLLSADEWISDFFDADRKLSYFCIGDFKSGKIINRRLAQEYLIVELGCGSRNGRYLAAWAQKYGKAADEIKFGLVTQDGKGFDWKVSLTLNSSECAKAMVHGVVPSDSGDYIAVAGWKNGVLLADLKNKKIVWVASPEYAAAMPVPTRHPWKTIPLLEIDTKDVAFAPDNKTIYAGGAMGCVYGMDVRTGKIVSKWWATETDKLENGHRISTVSVSPDGRFVAAGTGPEGQVYLFSTKDGKRRILNHGGSTILITSFSPDSKRLASFAAGQIKIWKLPDDAAGPKSGELKTRPKEISSLN
jgi:WD40 repeat protein